MEVKFKFYIPQRVFFTALHIDKYVVWREVSSLPQKGISFKDFTNEINSQPRAISSHIWKKSFANTIPFMAVVISFSWVYLKYLLKFNYSFKFILYFLVFSTYKTIKNTPTCESFWNSHQ